jgi:outer membrane receptor protein involved in Fe transport
MPLHNLEAELEWNHISKYYTSTDNADPDGLAKRPDLFNLRISYDMDDNWSFWGHVLNLTDQKYAERVSYGSSGRSYTVGSPRTFYAGVAYEF